MSSFTFRLFAAGSLASLLLLWSNGAVAGAGSRSVTWYLDGARIEQELDITGSYGEIILPPSLRPGSLTVKPVSRGELSRVELLPVKPDPSAEKELTRLDERRDSLQDRLRALAVKEEIFRATAKSQGSKAPRRTRTNPEPLAAIRQGTDFAIARLEEVYRARRMAERELKTVEQRLTALRSQEGISGSTVRIWLKERKGRVRVAYLTSGQGWMPLYDLRIAKDTATITLIARFPRGEKPGTMKQVVPGGMVDSVAVSPLPVPPGESATVSRYPLPVTVVRKMNGVQHVTTVTLCNETGVFLPPGKLSGFLLEEYIGQLPFSGLKPGEAATLVFGGSV